MHRIIVSLTILGMFCALAFGRSSSSAHDSFAYTPLEWHLTTTNAPFAWSHAADGHGVSVEVVDTGVDQTVAQTALAGGLAPSMSVNPLHVPVPVMCRFNPYGSCTSIVVVPNPTAYSDRSGHGTFVACEIACHGLVDAYYGIAPRARVIMAKVSLGEAISNQDVATAIRWGGIHHVAIISLSLGGTVDGTLLRQAVRFAQAQGCIIVAAAGNNGLPQEIYPSSYAGVIRVGAVDRWGRLAYFSNTTGISLVAPGFYVYGIAPMQPNTIAAGGLVTLSGTSMATPLVAGALADLLSWGLTPHQAVSAILHGATYQRSEPHFQYGAGILNLRGALLYAVNQHWT